MQNAKDTFYEVMKSRLAALDPDRTIVVRGATRPAILVEANELALEDPLPDCFRLRWLGVTVDAQSALPLVTQRCEIAYETAGTAINSGMDRGRILSALDADLAQIVNAAPQSAVKTNYAGLAFGQPAVAMKTNVWWSDVAFGAVTQSGATLARTATVDVMSYQEAGEL